MNTQYDKIDYSLPYERRYWPGMILRFNGHSGNIFYFYKVVSYRHPCKNDLVIDADVVRGFDCSLPNSPLWIVEPIWKYATAYHPGQIITDASSGKNYEVVGFLAPRRDEFYIEYSEQQQEPIVSNYHLYFNRWVVKPVLTEEERYKESLRRCTTERLIESGVGGVFTSNTKRAWFCDVLKERMK